MTFNKPVNLLVRLLKDFSFKILKYRDLNSQYELLLALISL